MRFQTGYLALILAGRVEGSTGPAEGVVESTGSLRGVGNHYPCGIPCVMGVICNPCASAAPMMVQQAPVMMAQQVPMMMAQQAPMMMGPPPVMYQQPMMMGAPSTQTVFMAAPQVQSSIMMANQQVAGTPCVEKETLAEMMRILTRLDEHLTSRDSSVDIPAAVEEASGQLTFIKHETPNVPPMHLIMGLINIMNQHAESMRDQSHADIQQLTKSLKHTIDELGKHLATSKEPKKAIAGPKAHTTDDEHRDTDIRVAQNLADMQTLGVPGTHSSKQDDDDAEAARLAEEQRLQQEAKAKLDKQTATLKSISDQFQSMGEMEDDQRARLILEQLKSSLESLGEITDESLAGKRDRLLANIQAKLDSLTNPPVEIHARDDAAHITAIEEKDESANKLESIRKELETLMSEVDALVQSGDKSGLSGKLEELKGQIPDIEVVEDAGINKMHSELIGKIDAELEKLSAGSINGDLKVDQLGSGGDFLVESEDQGSSSSVHSNAGGNEELTEDSVKAKLDKTTTVAQAKELASLVEASKSLTEEQKGPMTTKIQEKIDELNKQTEAELNGQLESVGSMNNEEAGRLIGKYSILTDLRDDLESLRNELLSKLRGKLNPTDTDADAQEKLDPTRVASQLQNMNTLGQDSTDTKPPATIKEATHTESKTGGDTALKRSSTGSGSSQDEDDVQEVEEDNLNGTGSEVNEGST